MESSESLQMLAGAVWGVVAFVCGLYFVGCYLLEILAQKLDEPRWMAWVPFLNGYLVFRLAGWGAWFWVLLAGWLLAPMLAMASATLAALVLIPVGLATLVLSLVIWLKVAERRGLSQVVGFLIVLPNLAPLLELFLPTMGLLTVGSWLAALGAFAYLVFYDGGPEHSPHPVGYLVTTGLAALIGIPMLMLPGALEDPELAARFARFESALSQARDGEAEGGEAGLEGDFWAQLEGTAPAANDPEAAARAAERAFVAPPDECPPGTRDAGARPPEGDHWWCEAQLATGEWVRHGPTRRWHEHGKVESEGVYDNGLEQGVWSRYWKTGGTRVRAEFADGQQNGWMRSWDELGRLESEVWFENGVPVESPASR